MNATSVLGNFFVRVGVVPAGAVFLVVFLRRLALRNGRRRPPLLSLQTFDVGFDLFVLAMVTAFTALIDRSTSLASTNRTLAALEGSTVRDQALLDEVHQRTGQLANGQLVSGVILAIAFFLAVLVASTVSQKGYDQVVSTPKRRSRVTVSEPILNRWGVLLPFAVGLLTLLMTLVTSR